MNITIKNIENLTLFDVVSIVKACFISKQYKQARNSVKRYRNDNRDYGCLSCNVKVTRTEKNLIGEME